MDTKEPKPGDAKAAGIPEWSHAPNLTPKGFELKKDELYVVSGDTLIKAYHVIFASRQAALLTAAKIPPTNLQAYEENLVYSRYINNILYQMVQSMSLPQVLEMQENDRVAKEQAKKDAETKGAAGAYDSLKNIVGKFGIALDGENAKDEKTPPSSEDGAVPAA